MTLLKNCIDAEPGIPASKFGCKEVPGSTRRPDQPSPSDAGDLTASRKASVDDFAGAAGLPPKGQSGTAKGRKNGRAGTPRAGSDVRRGWRSRTAREPGRPVIANGATDLRSWQAMTWTPSCSRRPGSQPGSTPASAVNPLCCADSEKAEPSSRERNIIC